MTDSNIIENQPNPCYEGVDQPTLAIYETISSHDPRNTEGSKYYEVLDRKQLRTIVDPDIIHAEADNMASYSKLELDSDDIKPEKNPAYATTTQSDPWRTTYYVALVHA